MYISKNKIEKICKYAIQTFTHRLHWIKYDMDLLIPHVLNLTLNLQNGTLSPLA